MEKAPIKYSAVSFARFAGDDFATWRKLKGQRVAHRSLGAGTIVGVCGDGRIYVSVCFDGEAGAEPSEFQTTAFERRVFDWLTVPSELVPRVETREDETRRLEQEERQTIRQEEARKLFLSLKVKYGCASFSDSSASSPLFSILRSLELKNGLSAQDVEWLERNSLFSILAQGCESAFRQTGDMWHAIRACGAWRKARLPRRGLQVTEGLFPADQPQLAAAILTTRGGAFRDLGQLEEAKDCAKHALSLAPESFRTLELMGAVLFDMGDAEAGKRCFEKAEELEHEAKRDGGAMWA